LIGCLGVGGFLFLFPTAIEPSSAVIFVIIEHECFDERAILLGGDGWMTGVN
jgi:hypothetical protein